MEHALDFTATSASGGNTAVLYGKVKNGKTDRGTYSRCKFVSIRKMIYVRLFL